MNKIFDALDEILIKFDQEKKPISERDVAKVTHPAPGENILYI